MCSQEIYDQLNSLAVWEHMAPITLAEMRSLKLMNRIDTKYVLNYDEVFTLLECCAKAGYMVQHIDGKRAVGYDTLYYDTPERRMYLMHHNRVLTRQKIRTRTYLSSGITFLEIKNKTNRGRTKKQRIEIPRAHFETFATDSAALDFFTPRSTFRREELSPAISTRFLRITLVNSALSERITIDLDLRYADYRSGHTAAIEGMAILELKQDGLTRSTMKELLRNMRIAPLKVSKYCLATALTVEEIKKNRFKLKLRDIEKRLGDLNIITAN
ncbi:MAG: polyphosphate polymerase domain-containing protein [Alistipes sp.]|nr:polyphosphate polymerase domain-containing protein [Alistipes sp.]